MNNDFYKDLKQIDDFSKIMEDKNYTKIPSDWIVLVSDIQDSTKAIEKGSYKDVNFISALCIIGVLNIDNNLDFPYIFGGDGASLLIPSSILEKAKKVFQEARFKAKEAFDLNLRIGYISVKEIEEKGSFIEVCKYKISNEYTQAIIRGNGLQLAEDLLKKEYETYKIDEEFSFDYTANFEGLECRWENIKTPKDETISILIKSINEKNSSMIYENCLKQIEQIAGDFKSRNPIQKDEQFILSFHPKILNTEAAIFTNNIFSRIFHIFRLMIENLLGVFLMKFGIGEWKEYKQRIIRTTDTEKFDDMLRMVISTKKEDTKKIEKFLHEKFLQNDLVYGIHQSDSALMTCLIFQRHGKHIHFVDSSNGGYAMAAKDLKKRLKEIIYRYS